MNKARTTVVSVIIGIVVAEIAIVVFGLVADILICMKWGTEYSISWTILSASHSYPVIPFLLGSIVFGFIGVLGGHLFASQHGDSPNISYDLNQDDKKDVLK